MRVDSNATKVESGVIFLEFVGMHLVERESFFFFFFVVGLVCLWKEGVHTMESCVICWGGGNGR